MIIGIHHVQITIPKEREQKARDFYCGILGLQEAQKPRLLQGCGDLWLQVGDKQVHVGAKDGVDRKLTKAHVAHEVNDLAFWRKRMQIAGLKLTDGEQIPGHKRFEFRDPFGNHVELIQKL